MKAYQESLQLENGSSLPIDWKDWKWDHLEQSNPFGHQLQNHRKHPFEASAEDKPTQQC